jgi:hypothetical protein
VDLGPDLIVSIGIRNPYPDPGSQNVPKNRGKNIVISQEGGGGGWHRSLDVLREVFFHTKCVQLSLIF